VAEEVWTPVQQTFLEELFRRTLYIFESQSPSELDPAAARQRIIRRSELDEIAQQEWEAFVESLPAQAVFSASTDEIKKQFLLARRAADEGAAVDQKAIKDLGVTEFTVCAPDEPGRLSQILGVMYAMDLSLVGIRAATTTSDQPQAIDVVTVSRSGRSLSAAYGKRTSDQLLAVLKGEKHAHELLSDGGKDPDRVQEEFRWKLLEGSPAILEIEAPKGRGMAYRMSRRIHNEGWNILAARAGQWAGRGAAAFYVEMPDGSPISDQMVRSALGELKV
jgi:[protein-PII] uridylyltransferase